MTSYEQLLISNHSGIQKYAYNTNKSYGIYINNTSSNFYNLDIDSVLLNIYRDSSVTDGNITCNLYNTNNTVQTQIWSAPVTDVTTDTAGEWFQPSTQTSIPGSDMTVGKWIGLEYDGSSSGNVRVGWQNSDVFDGTNTIWCGTYWDITSATTNTGRDMAFKVNTVTPSSDTVLLPPEPAMVRL